MYGSRNVCSNVTKKTFARYSFVSGMSWGFSGNLGFPLPSNWSLNQIREYQVVNGNDKFDLDHDVWRDPAKGGDPGQSTVNTDKVSSLDLFQDYVQRIYDLAVQYGKGDPNKLALEYARGSKYRDAVWAVLLGAADQGFISYVDAQKIKPIATIVDPATGYDIETFHTMATASGHYAFPKPQDPEMINDGDIAGWGGDLLTFYSDWRAEVESYASGYTYALAKLARPGVSSSFGYGDLIEDADGYLISQKLLRGMPLPQAVREHYSKTEVSFRFRNYFQQRFTNFETARILASKMLTFAASPRITAAQGYLSGNNPSPSFLPQQKIAKFCQGFAEVLITRSK